MKLKNILNKSVYGSIATVTGEESLEKAYGFLEYNKDFIQSFPTVILALNKTSTCVMKYVLMYENMWKERYPGCYVLYNEKNRGHMFGTIDLEESILEYMKDHRPASEYLFKSTEDMLLSTNMLEIDYPEGDFYYYPGFSYESIIQAGGVDNLFNIIKSNTYPDWTPQTNFYILNIKNISTLYGNDIHIKRDMYLNDLKLYPGLKPWEVKFEDGIKFDCEHLLAKTVEPMKKILLINDADIKNLINFVASNQIGDPSHKNLLFKETGSCHFHFWKNEVHLIGN